jgi:hypothetical protein
MKRCCSGWPRPSNLGCAERYRCRKACPRETGTRSGCGPACRLLDLALFVAAHQALDALQRGRVAGRLARGVWPPSAGIGLSAQWAPGCSARQASTQQHALGVGHLAQHELHRAASQRLELRPRLLGQACRLVEQLHATLVGAWLRARPSPIPRSGEVNNSGSTLAEWTRSAAARVASEPAPASARRSSDRASASRLPRAGRAWRSSRATRRAAHARSKAVDRTRELPAIGHLHEARAARHSLPRCRLRPAAIRSG